MNPPPPRLKLERAALTVNTKSELQLDFVAGQRGLMSSITIYVLQGINVSLANTTVDVVGGLNFTLPNGRHVGYIENTTFHDIRIKVKTITPSLSTLASRQK